MLHHWKIMKLLAAASMALATASPWAAPLAAYNVDPATVTVSGISSGGIMAVQAHVAYSTTFRGAAIFAGTPYYCAEAKLGNFNRCTFMPASIPVGQLAAITRQWAQQGLIDAVANLQKTPVYLFSGTNDVMVRPAAMDALNQYYRHFIPKENIRYMNRVPAGHGWISPRGPVACASQQAPYINDCGMDPQQEFLSMFYGRLQPKQDAALTGQVMPVDQAEFLEGKPAAYSMDMTGWLYVPANCSALQKCRLHVSLHGCSQSYSAIGQSFVSLSGLNEWADTNSIIVLYPQTRPSMAEPDNPQGCWDWWGYTGTGYAQKTAPQLRALKLMVDRITSGTARAAEKLAGT